MTSRPEEPMRPFSPFRSAAEEADMKGEAQRRDDEGGHMSCTGGRIVRNVGARMPYTVVLTLPGGETRQRDFPTMQEAEAFVRRNTPLPASRSTLHDHGDGDA
jgi:hypothetical protein